MGLVVTHIVAQEIILFKVKLLPTYSDSPWVNCHPDSFITMEDGSAGGDGVACGTAGNSALDSRV